MKERMVVMNEKETKKISLPKYSFGEEMINTISHGFGVGLGIVALVLSIVKSCNPFSGIKLLASIVFGVSLIVLYSISMTYHLLGRNNGKRVLRVLDHCSIFILIAGTYTPYTLVALSGTTIGKVISITIWALAAVGILLNSLSLKKFAVISVIVYIVMGWLIVIAFKPMAAHVAGGGLSLLIWGGVAYTVGAILYAIGSKKKYFHSVFHFFCLIGSLLHFFSVFFFVL